MRSTLMLLLLAAAACITMPAAAQRYGSGVGKTTYSVSDAMGASQWMLSLLPTTPDYPNGCKSCGQLGRVRLSEKAAPEGTCYIKHGSTQLVSPWNADVPVISCLKTARSNKCDFVIGMDIQSPNAGELTAATPLDCCAACAADSNCTGASFVAGYALAPSQGFGLHAVHVNASSARPFGTLSNKKVEEALDVKLNAVYNGGGYDAFLDFTSGHWVSSLDPYTALYDSVGVPFVLLSWEANSQKYYSLIVRVHTSMMLIELMSSTCTKCGEPSTLLLPSPYPRYRFKSGQTPEQVFGSLNDANASRPLMHAARVSWPTSNLIRDRKLFHDSGFATSLFQSSYAGASVDGYDFTSLSSVATLQFQLVQRPASNTSGNLTIAQFEQAMLQCHEAALVDDVCGFDQWLDNHMGMSPHKSNFTISSLTKILQALGLKYHVNEAAGGQFHAIYLSAPNGLAISIDGLQDGEYKPTRPIGKGEVDLCNMGTCKR